MLYTLLVSLWFAPLMLIEYVLLCINGDHKDKKTHRSDNSQNYKTKKITENRLEA